MKTKMRIISIHYTLLRPSPVQFVAIVEHIIMAIIVMKLVLLEAVPDAARTIATVASHLQLLIKIFEGTIGTVFAVLMLPYNHRKIYSTEHCLLGFWSQFCSPIESLEDIEKYLELTPYPHDKRCGCPICPDCRPQMSCPHCSGCAVCNNIVNPGPYDIQEIVNKTWTAPTANALSQDDKPVRDFFAACKEQGDLYIFRKYIETRATVLVADATKKTPLHYVCNSAESSKKVEMARVLILNTPDWAYLYYLDSHDLTPLEYAIKNYSLNIVEMLLFPGALFSQDDNDAQRRMTVSHETLKVFGVPLIHWACGGKKKEQLFVATLLATSTSLNDTTAQLLFGSADADGNTPILLALLNGNAELAKLLISERNAYSGRNRFGQNALHITCTMESKKDIIEVFRMLVIADRRLLDMQDIKGDTPLHYIARMRGFENDYWYEQLILMVAGTKSKSHTMRNKKGKIPLHLASSILFVSHMTRFLSEADINLPDNKGRTPLCYAFSTENIQLVKVMLSMKTCRIGGKFLFDHNIDIDGRYLIHWLLLEPKWHEIARILLIDRKIALDERLDDEGTTVISLLFSNSDLLMLTDSVIFKRSNELSLTKMIDKDGNNPLHNALLNRNIQLAWLLSSHEPSLCSMKNAKGELPLHVACRYHDRESVLQFSFETWIIVCDMRIPNNRNLCKHLLEKGYVFDFKDVISSPISSVRQIDGARVACTVDGDTPLHIACKAGNDVFVFALVSEYEKRGIPIDITNHNRQTPLLSCCASEVVCRLRQPGARDNCSAQDASFACRQKALYFRQKVKFENISAFLISRQASVDAMDDLGHSALQYACKAGFLYTVHKLVAKTDSQVVAASLMRRMSCGKRAVDYLIELFNASEYLDSHDLEILTIIFTEYISNLDGETVDGEPVVVWACLDPKRWDLAEILISKRGEEVDNLTVEGVPLLQWVCLDMSRLRLAEILFVDRRMNIHNVEIDGVPLLEWACSDRTRFPLAEMLIIKLQCCYLIGALQRILVKICKDTNLLPLVKLIVLKRRLPLDDSVLVDGDPMVSWAIRQMCSHRSEIAMMLIVDRQLPLNHLRIDGQPILIWICQQFNSVCFMRQALDFLLQRDDVDRNVQDCNGDTALHHACNLALENPGKFSEAKEIIDSLLSYSNGRGTPASVNIQNLKLNTPLHDVCSSPRKEDTCRKLIDVLLRRRRENVEVANLNLINGEGNTVLHILCQRARKVCLEAMLLYQLPVRFGIQNSLHQTVFQLAEGNRELAKILRRAAKRGSKEFN